jgi:metal-responsive CopG/Arc/MetJ family transcriptional regulator
MTGNDGARRKISISISEEALAMIEQMAQSQGGSFVSHVIEDCVRQTHRRWEKENRRTPAKKPIPKRVPTRAQRDALVRGTKTVESKRRRRGKP